jgi:lipid A ethanolaminephosphotransferase
MVAGNAVLWLSVSAVASLTAVVSLGVMIVLVWLALMSLLGWPWVAKPLLALALLLSACTTHFMATYGVVIDPTMIANALATDAHEVRDLLSWRFAFTVLLVAAPGWWALWRWPMRWPVGWRGVAQRLAIGALALAAVLPVLWVNYADLASLMRNHKAVRYQINPFNSVYGAARLWLRQPPGQGQVLQAVALDARLRDVPGSPPPLLMLVVGETARAANFGLAGYARDTTPHLRQWQAQGQLVYWPNATSCGTNTHVSVPCMFSPLTRSEGADEPAQHENLLDVLQRAGLAVLWLDNQSGCKGVCDRVPNTHVTKQPDPQWCFQGECLDEALLQGLDARIEALDPVRRARGVVVVLHQMGSHGPAYFKRAPSDRKLFAPECSNVTLTECPPEQLINAYDNSVAYTDHVLHQALLWLQARERDGRFATGLIYASDHGESLGEKGLYLHGAPWAFAPREQTHVPMLAWYSTALAQRLKLDLRCMKDRAEQPVSHDHLFDSVLGAVGVQTQAQRPGLDWHSVCLGS